MNLIKLLPASLILLLTATQTLSGQKSFHPGYIVTNDNAQVMGLIDISGLKTDSYSISFRETDTSMVLTFTPSMVKAFKYDSDYYVSAEVEADMSADSPEKLLERLTMADAVHAKAFMEANNAYVEKVIPTGDVQYRSGDTIMTLKPDNIKLNIFLKAVVAGTVNLFYFRDNLGKEHFYISNTYGTKEELNRLFYADNTKLVSLVVYEVDYYKPQLIKYMAGDADFEKRVLKTQYNLNSLAKLVNDYNTSTSRGAVMISSQETIIKYGVTAGGGLINLNFISHSSPLDYIDFGYKPIFMAGGKVEVNFPGAQRRFSLVSDLSARYFKTDGTGSKPYYEYSSSFEVAYVQVSPMIRFRITEGDIYPFVNAGFFYSFFIMNENSITEEHYGNTMEYDAISDDGLRKQEQGFNLGAGMNIKKFSLEGRYEFGNGYSKAISMQSLTGTLLFSATYTF